MTDMSRGGSLTLASSVTRYLGGSISANIESELMPAKTSLGVDSSKGCWFTFTLGLTGLVTGVSVGEDAGSEANVFDGSEGGSEDGSEEDGSEEVGDLWTIGGVPDCGEDCPITAMGLRGVITPEVVGVSTWGAGAGGAVNVGVGTGVGKSVGNGRGASAGNGKGATGWLRGDGGRGGLAARAKMHKSVFLAFGKRMDFWFLGINGVLGAGLGGKGSSKACSLGLDRVGGVGTWVSWTGGGVGSGSWAWDLLSCS